MQPDPTAESRYALALCAHASAARRGGNVKDELRALLRAAFDHHRLRDTIPDLAHDEYGDLFAFLFGPLNVDVVCAHLFP